MLVVASLRETTLAPRIDDSAPRVCARLSLGTLSRNSALPFGLPLDVTLEESTMPFSFATIWNTCWATSSIRAGAVASWSSADWTIWRLPDGSGAGAGASDAGEFAEKGLPAEEAAAWLGAGRRLAGGGADRSCALADDDDVLLDPPPW